jgi:MoxR-like ATPase
MDKLEQLQITAQNIRTQIGKVVIGHYSALDQLLVCLLTQGHVLLEGVPGVAKTLTAKLLAKTVGGAFKRIQFTPDLMPSDILGTSVFNPKTLDFEYKKGPAYSNFLLIDEINRAPAKTQSALFELMEERQITMDGNTYRLEDPFMVIATQNPIDQEGTYRLPDAQMDRFLMKITVEYPTPDEETTLLLRFHNNEQNSLVQQVEEVTTAAELLSFREITHQISMDEKLISLLVKMVHSTRHHKWIERGVSPRASLALMQATKTWAALNGRDFVLPEDLHAMAYPVWRHRLLLTPEAEMEGIPVNEAIKSLLASVEIPR